MNGNNSQTSSNGSKGIGFVGVLQLIFIVLKLCGLINWSWLWVLSPLWISALVTLLIIIVGVSVYVITDRH